ncbi:hypothetical protein DY000_02021235 [Brassica cretica]|uniref:Uncharacterized protein n=1 Tax=Brassica cretica TaxID=69181 RepID=A0ABQ7E5F5_BRACR|nr:hypothetical protein DY000_02021235 [Brassica cretica]
MKQQRAPTRLERRGMLYPLALSRRSETTPRRGVEQRGVEQRGVERRGFPYPRCRRETVHGSRGDDDAGCCTRSHEVGEARRHRDAGWSGAGSLTRVVEEIPSMDHAGTKTRDAVPARMICMIVSTRVEIYP